MNEIQVTQEQLDNAASLINLAIENHATAVDLTGLGCLVYVLQELGVNVNVRRSDESF